MLTMVPLFIISSLGLLLAVSAHGKQCGTKLSESDVWRIVGGQDAVKGAWPWQALLLTKTYWGPPRPICGGSVIDKQWMLTAAHCVKDHLQPKQYLVRVGEHNTSVKEGSEIDLNVTKVLLHEYFDAGTNDNDLALIKFSHPIDIDSNENINRVCIPEDSDQLEGKMCVTTGWGDTKFNGFIRPEVLQEVSIPVVRQQDCADAYKNVNPVTPRMICAGVDQGGKGICHGDSGGPLVCKIADTWQLIGVTSWGVGCAKVGRPGVYARVSSYRTWINNKILTN